MGKLMTTNDVSLIYNRIPNVLIPSEMSPMSAQVVILAETLWSIPIGKRIKSEYCLSKETLYSAVQNILGGVGEK